MTNLMGQTREDVVKGSLAMSKRFNINNTEHCC